MIMGEAVHVWGQRVYEKSLYFLNFSVNLKLLLKKSLKKLHQKGDSHVLA